MTAGNNAHLLRELKGIIENHPEQTWPKTFIDLLLEALDIVKKAKEQGRYSLPDEYLQRYDARYDEIIKLAHEENPYPEPPPEKKRGRKKKGKVLSLIERLEEYKASVLCCNNELCRNSTETWYKSIQCYSQCSIRYAGSYICCLNLNSYQKRKNTVIKKNYYF